MPSAAGQRTYLSINRTGLAGTAFELDDRLVASVDRAAADGWTGVKLMTRIAPDDPGGAAAWSCSARCSRRPVRRARGADRAGGVAGRAMSRATDDVVLAAVIAHDLGAPLLKVPVPDAPAGAARVEAVARVVAASACRSSSSAAPRRGQSGCWTRPGT